MNDGVISDAFDSIEGDADSTDLDSFQKSSVDQRNEIDADEHDAIDSVPSLHGKRLETERDITAAITKSCSEDTKRAGMLMVPHAYCGSVSICSCTYC